MFDLHKMAYCLKICQWAKKLFFVGILIFYHLAISSCGNHKFIKQAYNLDWSDIKAGLCICFLYKPGFY